MVRLHGSRWRICSVIQSMCDRCSVIWSCKECLKSTGTCLITVGNHHDYQISACTMSKASDCMLSRRPRYDQRSIECCLKKEWGWQSGHVLVLVLMHACLCWAMHPLGPCWAGLAAGRTSPWAGRLHEHFFFLSGFFIGFSFIYSRFLREIEFEGFSRYIKYAQDLDKQRQFDCQPIIILKNSPRTLNHLSSFSQLADLISQKSTSVTI